MALVNFYSIETVDMSEAEVKRSLEDRGLRIADLARQLVREYPLTIKSADSMLRDLIAGKRWFPQYAAWLKENYQISVKRPDHLRPVRERMKIAA